MKKFTVEVHQDNHSKSLKVLENENLLDVLRKNDYQVFAPCGGNGTCGKCQVIIQDIGSVTSCIYPIVEDIKVFLSAEKRVNILTAQHEHCIELALNPGKAVDLSPTPYGIAIDIGTTTLVYYILDLKTGAILQTRSTMNPQGKYGADVISRINYCANSPEKLEEIQLCLINEINSQLKILEQSLKISLQNITKISIAGNPTMLHLLLGIDPLGIALAPFKPAFIDHQSLMAKKLNLVCNPEAYLEILPSISAYVGADIVAGIASIKPDDRHKNYLFIDIGTNGEMALVTPEKIWCCATAAGPAFEGGNISSGMGAFAGAISEYDGTEFKTIEDEEPQGICGSGLVDIIAHLVNSRIIPEDGFLEEDFILHKGDSKSKEVSVNQQDIREVQLAKSAILAGINILVSTAGLEYANIDALFLAGGFGNYINVENAIKIGLLPGSIAGKIISIGNASASGAILSLKSEEFDKIIDQVIQKSEYIELSTHDDFVMEYAMNMNF